MAGWIAVGSQQCIIMLRDIGRYFQLHLWQTIALLRCCDSVELSADVQDNVVIAVVLVVSMGEPVARLVVDFDVTHPQRTPDFNLCIEEIGPRIVVVQAGIYHFHRLPVGRREGFQGEHLVFPDVMQELLHDILRQFVFYKNIANEAK